VALAVHLARAEGGVDAEETQNTQEVLLDTRLRLADETYAARGNVVEPADIIVHHAVGADRERIDGEIAPPRIADPITAEGYLGLAAESFGVLTQRRDFERLAVDHQRHRAVLDAGRHALDASLLRAPDHFLGQRRGRDVDVDDRNIEQRVAH